MSVYPKAMHACPENTLDEIYIRVEELDAELQATVDNPEVLLRYQTTKQQAEAAQTEYQLALEQSNNIQGSYNAQLQEWKDQVTSIETKLNILFGVYM